MNVTQDISAAADPQASVQQKIGQALLIWSVGMSEFVFVLNGHR
jgi:hypothetical protein